MNLAWILLVFIKFLNDSELNINFNSKHIARVQVCLANILPKLLIPKHLMEHFAFNSFCLSYKTVLSSFYKSSVHILNFFGRFDLRHMKREWIILFIQTFAILV